MTAVSAFMYMVQWFSKETARKFLLFSRSLRRDASSVASLTSSANCTSMITIITFMLALASAWVWIGQLSFYELEQMYCSVDASSSIQNGDFRENTLQYFKCIPFILLFMMSTFIFKWKKIRFWDHDDNYFLNCFVPPPAHPTAIVWYTVSIATDWGRCRAILLFWSDVSNIVRASSQCLT